LGRRYSSSVKWKNTNGYQIKDPRFTPQWGQTIVSNPKWNSRLLSIRFIQWYLLIKLAEFLYEIATGEAEWGVDRGGEREREREKESSRLKEWEREHWTEMEMVWVINGH
jgi:hypothetical protein